MYQVADLVKHINDLVKQLYSDLWCSLFRQGNYQMAPAFQHPHIPYAHWDMQTIGLHCARSTAVVCT